MTTEIPAKLRQALDFQRIVLVQGNIKIELDWVSEGLNGDYEPDDPQDEPMLRFWIMRRIREDDPKVKDARLIPDKNHLNWQEVDDASYCTQLKATDPRGKLIWATQFILDTVADPAEARDSIKRICENLSRISKDGFKFQLRNPGV